MTSAPVSRTNGMIGRLALCVIVSACFILNGCDQTEKTRQVVDQRASEAQKSLDSAQKPPHPKDYNPLTVTNKVWNGNAALRMQRGMPLPARYEVPRGVTLVSADPMSLNDIATAISAQTGIPVRLSALTIAKASASAASSPASLASPAPAAASLSSGAASGSAVSIAGNEMPVSYEGPLSGLLERLSAYFGVNWHYDGSSITISRYETRIFAVEALPGTQQMSDSFTSTSSTGGGSSSGGSGSGGGSSGGGGSGGSSSSSGGGGSSSGGLDQNSKFMMDFKYWDELSQVLGSIIGGQGNVVISPTMGAVTVTTTPEIMTTVADYLGKENKRLSRQIAINVQIYSVNLGQSEDFNVSFTALLHRLSDLNYTSAGAPTITNPALTTGSSSFGSLGIAILNGSSQTQAADIFKALSTIGDTTSVAQFPMTTLNNRPVSRVVGTNTTYVSSITENTTSSTSTTTTYVPTTSSLQTGFSIQLTPRLLDDGRIMLQYSMSLADAEPPQTATFSGNTITLPVVNNRIFVQQSMLRSGQTLMIGGVDQEDLQQNKNGVGSPDNYLLGGGFSTNNNHYMLFMAITPQVMDDGDAEHV